MVGVGLGLGIGVGLEVGAVFDFDLRPFLVFLDFLPFLLFLPFLFILTILPFLFFLVPVFVPDLAVPDLDLDLVDSATHSPLGSRRWGRRL